MRETTSLRRDIGLTGAIFLSFNGIVGAGIFALPAILHVQFGAFSPWLFPIFALLMLSIALPFARLAVLVPASGGPVAYVAGFGRPATFQIGWLYYLTRVASLSANANVFAIYAASLWPPLGAPVARAATIALLVALLAVLNVVGVKRAIRALDVLTLLKALPLIGLAVWGLIETAGALPAPGPPPSLTAVEAAALVIVYAFLGFENAALPAEETRDPVRTIPRALIATVIGTAAIYFLIQLAYVAVMPAGAAPEAPLAAFAEALVGPVGAVLLALVALASVAGNLTGALMSSSRVTFAMARDGLLPRWFAAISPRFATPANSVLFMSLIGIALAVSGSFVWLAAVSALARFTTYAASIAALPGVQRRAGRRVDLATILMVGIGLAACLWVLAQSTWSAWAMLGALIAGGTLLYVAARRQAGSNSAATVSAIQPPPSTRSPS